MKNLGNGKTLDMVTTLIGQVKIHWLHTSVGVCVSCTWRKRKVGLERQSGRQSCRKADNVIDDNDDADDNNEVLVVDLS